jgi:uncharacterized protein YecA (UPF0149 family)
VKLGSTQPILRPASEFATHPVAELIPACVIEIAAYWRQRRPTLSPGSGQTISASLKANQPGRNDPCPCSSGRTYKVCCGRLH